MKPNVNIKIIRIKNHIINFLDQTGVKNNAI